MSSSLNLCIDLFLFCLCVSVKEFLAQAKEEFQKKWDHPPPVSTSTSILVIDLFKLSHVLLLVLKLKGFVIPIIYSILFSFFLVKSITHTKLVNSKYFLGHNPVLHYLLASTQAYSINVLLAHFVNPEMISRLCMTFFLKEFAHQQGSGLVSVFSPRLINFQKDWNNLSLITCPLIESVLWPEILSLKPEHCTSQWNTLWQSK